MQLRLTGEGDKEMFMSADKVDVDRSNLASQKWEAFQHGDIIARHHGRASGFVDAA